MSESQAETPKISRRNILKKITVGTVGIGAAAVVGNEVQKGLQGIKTEAGTFIPLYERHDQGISVKTVPDDLDGFFREVSTAGEFMFGSSPKDFFKASGSPYGTSLSLAEAPTFKKEILAKLAREGAEIIVGDVFISDTDVKEYRTQLAATSAALLAAFFLGTQSLGRSVDAKIGIARRKLLQKGLLGVGLWGVSKPRYLYSSVKSISERENALTRIAARIEGMGSQLHPELPLVFFRNLVMADKILIVAEQMRREKGKNPKIAFNVEGGHSGIEDFLQIGCAIIHKLILAYPENWRNKVVELNGGVDNFCSARLFKLPRDFQAADLESDTKMREVSSRTIVDKDLRKAIANVN